MDLLRRRKMLPLRPVLLLAAALLAGAGRAGAMEPPPCPDRPVTTAEYRLPPRIDPDIRPKVVTEIWGQLWAPAKRDRAESLPLLLFLHGNHGTCGTVNPTTGVREDFGSEYTDTGTCPPPSVVVPNHMGYAYMARSLAQCGFVVVSINANRGITAAGADGADPDFGLILPRARLILKHLSLLQAWGSGDEDPPEGIERSLLRRLDPTRIGVMGHSRGGDGAVWAQILERERNAPWDRLLKPETRIGAVFAIAPTEFLAFLRPPQVRDAALAVLLPRCDGDVSDQQGMRFFDQALRIGQESRSGQIKAAFAVSGANHNFFNTEWQVSDAQQCYGGPRLYPELRGSAAQRRIGLLVASALFRGLLADDADRRWLNLFDPASPLPDWLARLTRVERSFSPGLAPPRAPALEAFRLGAGVSDGGRPWASLGVQTSSDVPGLHHLDPAMRLTWRRPARVPLQTGPTWAELPLAEGGSGLKPPAWVRSLSLRLTVGCDLPWMNGCAAPTRFLPYGQELDLGLRLLDSDGRSSALVRVSRHASLRGAEGVAFSRSGRDFSGAFVALLQTVRIPLSAFRPLPPGGIDRLRIETLGQGMGDAFLGGPIEWSPLPGNAAPQPGPVPPLPRFGEPVIRPFDGSARILPQPNGRVRQRRPLEQAASPAILELSLLASRPIPIRSSAPMLVIGSGRKAARFPHLVIAPDRRRFTVTMPRDALDSLPDGAPIALSVGGAGPLWPVGSLDRAALGLESSP